MQFRGVQCCRLLVYINRIEFFEVDDDHLGKDRRVLLGPGIAYHVGEAPTIGTVCGNLGIKMSTPSRSRSSTRSSKG